MIAGKSFRGVQESYVVPVQPSYPLPAAVPIERGPRGEAVAQTSRHLPPTGIPDTPHGRGSSRTSFLVQSALGLHPIRSRGGNGRSERSERSTDQKRAMRPRCPKLPENMSTYPRASDRGGNWGRESR
ncbi:hypothetical protein NDU88_002629 [Pleurodeles waltl]|uniref:Uncharacterized protein n=1 Tax=Pleurodeles waltl TaxID=8319 RepID=A0AAV7WSX2_PLEWA|nr:hypothetical protein NDU88_002629 [Pleurodeles waltl]